MIGNEQNKVIGASELVVVMGDLLSEQRAGKLVSKKNLEY